MREFWNAIQFGGCMLISHTYVRTFIHTQNNPLFVEDLKGQKIYDPTLRPCNVSVQKDQGAQILIMQTILVLSPLALRTWTY